AGAERDALDPSGGGEDRVEMRQAAGGLNDRDQIDRAFGKAALALDLLQYPIDRRERCRALHLGQDNAVEPAARDRDEIAIAERGIDGIDADIQESGARLPECCRDRIAGRYLLGRRDRIFKVENDGVGVEGQRLCDTARMITRREQKTAEQGNGGLLSSLSRGAEGANLRSTQRHLEAAL